MTKVTTLLSERFKSSGSNKMKQLAQRSSKGQLSSFSGLFKVAPLSESEKSDIKKIITQYKKEEEENETDLTDLLSLTSEVKAINNQAIILHGERIKRAQTLLKKYKDGAFSTWLTLTYGNRQTPYNFLQYYEFYQSLKIELREKMHEMPKQAIYTLASRKGEKEQKEAIIQTYNGEPKRALIEKIRTRFPLRYGDKRAQNLTESLLTELEKAIALTENERFAPTKEDRQKIRSLLSTLRKNV
ncbi:MAG: hypothetical protein S4CHLAM102_06950 [Chlamydiia bacterium]|nr:hypothetical protein [Chlamydiia bacterium]